MFVHPINNPGNIEFNTTLFMFVKSWFVPAEEGTSLPDSWLRVPAIQSPGLSAGTFIYTPININIETVAMMSVTEEGKVLKASRVDVSQKVIDAEKLAEIREQAIDISAWEQQLDKPWPYRDMFNSQLISARYRNRYGEDRAPFHSILSDTNVVYNEARASVMARPCNCGKKNVNYAP